MVQARRMSQVIPTDLGPYGIPAAVVAAVGVVIAVVGKYLDDRRKKAIDEVDERRKVAIAEAIAPLMAEINHMKEQIVKLQDGCKNSQSRIIDAMLLPAESHEPRQKLLKEACAFLS